MEVQEEASYTPQHRRRPALFFATMHHFCDEQRAGGRQVAWSSLKDKANRGSLPSELQHHECTAAEAAGRNDARSDGDVQRTFPHNPGRLDDFDLPAERALKDFLTHRLASVGCYQDAMRGGEAFLFHSRLSVPPNLYMLRPREVVDAALRQHEVPLSSLEGSSGRSSAGANSCAASIGDRCRTTPSAMRSTPICRCRAASGPAKPICALREAIRHAIGHAYVHNIERLMVLGQFCMLLGVRPCDVCRWHISMFIGATDWVSLPNALGMSQHAGGGVLGTKPCAASGDYINPMSDHRRFDPHKSVGEDACPFTTLDWDFPACHARRFRSNRHVPFGKSRRRLSSCEVRRGTRTETRGVSPSRHM